MELTRRNHMVNILLPVALLLLFAVSAMAVLLFATRAYRAIVEDSAGDDASRTALAYVSEKLHRQGSAGEVSLGAIEDRQALVLAQRFGGEAYNTYIYEYDGTLRELFVRAGTEVFPAAGRAVMELEDFAMERLTDRVYRFTCRDGAGRTASAVVTVRAGEEAAP